jgi:copper(I)-binding protein
MARLSGLVKLGAALLLAACGAEEASEVPGSNALATVELDDGGRVTVSDGFVRPAPDGATSTAGYLTITSSVDAAIASAKAEAFGMAELHESSSEGGVMRMRQVESVPLPARQTVSLAPGGLHLMLMQPTGELVEGDEVDLTLTLESGETVKVTLPVERR